MASCDMELVYPIPLMGENYFDKLNRSAQDVVDEVRKGTSNLSQFIQVFYELTQSKRDPPLEAIWFYSALSFRCRETVNEGGLYDRVTAVKQLFQLVSGCSAPCSASTSIALLAPVVFELYKLVREVLSGDLGAKRVKKVVKKVQSLIGSVLGYVSVCREASSEEKDSSLMVKFADLVGVWMEVKEEMMSFLPILNDEVRREIGAGGFSVNQLAGAVTAELFLLKLCVDLRVGNRVEMEKELKSWIVGSISGFRSFYFFDILLRMLLEPNLPVASLLSSEEVILLRTTLYDAVMLVEYTFLNPRTAIDLPAENFISIGLKRLILYLEATEFFRKEGNHKRAISYSSSFAGSPLPWQIIKYVTSQIGMEVEAGRLHVSSPKALIKWLFSLESQGIRIFDNSISRTRVKLALDSSSKAENVEPEGNIANSDLPFYIDNKGEKEGEDGDEEDKEMSNVSMTAALMAAARSMTVVESEEGKKRKQGRSEGKNKKKRSKLVAAQELSDDNSDSDVVLGNDGSCSESEVENPTSDEDA